MFYIFYVQNRFAWHREVVSRMCTPLRTLFVDVTAEICLSGYTRKHRSEPGMCTYARSAINRVVTPACTGGVYTGWGIRWGVHGYVYGYVHGITPPLPHVLIFSPVSAWFYASFARGVFIPAVSLFPRVINPACHYSCVRYYRVPCFTACLFYRMLPCFEPFTACFTETV